MKFSLQALFLGLLLTGCNSGRPGASNITVNLDSLVIADPKGSEQIIRNFSSRYSQNSDPENLLKCYDALAYFYQEQGRPDSAMAYLIKGYDLLSQTSKMELRAPLEYRAAILALQMWKKKEALAIIEDLLKLLNRLETKSNLYIRALILKGTIYRSMNMPDSTKHYCELALKSSTAPELELSHQLAKLYLNSLKIAKGDKHVEVYRELQSCLPFFTSKNLRRYILMVNLDLTNYSVEVKDTGMVGLHYRICRKLIHGFNNPGLRLHYFNTGIRADTALKGGKYRSPYIDSFFQVMRGMNVSGEDVNLFNMLYSIREKSLEMERLELQMLRKSDMKNYFILLFLLTTVALVTYIVWTNRIRNMRAQWELSYSVAMLSSIRSRMDSHFLSNIISSIQLLILGGKSTEGANNLGDLSHYLRKLFIHGEKRFMAIEEELELIQSYVGLEAARFHGTLHFSIDRSLVSDSFMLPSFMLQPLVENTIYHAGKTGELRILVLLSKHGEGHLIKIYSNGCPLPETSTMTDFVRKGRSLSVIMRRLELLRKLKEMDVSIRIHNTDQDSDWNVCTLISIKDTV